MLPKVAKKTMRLIARNRKAAEQENVTRTNTHPSNESTEHARSMETMASKSRSVKALMAARFRTGGNVGETEQRHRRAVDQGGGEGPAYVGMAVHGIGSLILVRARQCAFGGASQWSSGQAGARNRLQDGKWTTAWGCSEAPFTTPRLHAYHHTAADGGLRRRSGSVR